MISIARDNFNYLYRETLDQILLTGESAAPRGQGTKEVIGATLRLTQPQYNLLYSPVRKLNIPFGVAEFMWMILGQNDARSISYFNKQLGQFSDDGVYFHGAYGPKIVEQLPYIIRKLTEDPNSRQAVITMWRERPGTTKDVPCTVSFQFFLRPVDEPARLTDAIDRANLFASATDETVVVRPLALHMVTYMRSNDAWLGLPYDIFNFTMIQQVVAGLLGARLGEYTHMVGSLHLYEQHLEKAASVVGEDRNWSDTYQYALATPGFTKDTPPQIRPWFNMLAENWALSAGGLGDPFDVLQMLRTVPAPWGDLLHVLACRTSPSLISQLPHPWCEVVNP